MCLNGPLNWRAQTYKVPPDSTAEAEVGWMSKGAKDVAAFRMLLEDAKRPVTGPTPLLGDSKAARDWIVKVSRKARRNYHVTMTGRWRL